MLVSQTNWKKEVMLELGVGSWKPALIVTCWDRAPRRANSTHHGIKGTDNSSFSAFISCFQSLNTAPSNFFQMFNRAFGIMYWMNTAKADPNIFSSSLNWKSLPPLVVQISFLASTVVSLLSVDWGVLVRAQLVFNSGSCCLLLCRVSSSANFNKLLPLGMALNWLSTLKHLIYLRKCCTFDCVSAKLSGD